VRTEARDVDVAIGSSAVKRFNGADFFTLSTSTALDLENEAVIPCLKQRTSGSPKRQQKGSVLLHLGVQF
jgi:hypothetical protein